MPYLNLLIEQLKESFPDIKVYDEPVSQGLATPCFIISFEQKQNSRQFNDQLKLNVFYVITYIPDIADEPNNSSETRSDMYSVALEFMTNPNWRYLGESFHINNLVTEYKQDVMLIKFNIETHYKYVLPVVEPMEGIWVGTTIYDPINNPGVDPNDPNNPDNPGNPTDPDNPDNPDPGGNMGSIIIN